MNSFLIGTRRLSGRRPVRGFDCWLWLIGTVSLAFLLVGAIQLLVSINSLVLVRKMDLTARSKLHYRTFESVPVTLPNRDSVHLVLGPFRFDEAVALKDFELELKPDTCLHHIIVYRSRAFVAGKDGVLGVQDEENCCRPENVVYAWSKSTRSSSTKVFSTAPDTAFLIASPPNLEKFLYFAVHFEPFHRSTAVLRESIKLKVGYLPLSSPRTTVSPLSVGVIYADRINLPPNKADVQVCVSCKLSRDLTVTAYRNHAHSAARLLETNVYRSGVLLGKLGTRSAQDAQVFVPSSRWKSEIQQKSLEFGKRIELKRGDDLYLHCHYNTMGRQHYTSVGLNPKVYEMCNQYLMYFPYERDSEWATCETVDCEEESKVKRKFVPAQIQPRLPRLGQISGVAASRDGRSLFVLARKENSYLSQQVILGDTIFHIDTRSGKILNSFGRGQFVVPHGLYLDSRNVLWVTDTTLHQVFALDSTSGEVIKKLGMSRTAGKGRRGFNGPTDVAVSMKGEVFIADGYGNSRIVVYSYEGRYLREWGSKGSMPGQFRIPHNLALDKDGLVYVADRENSRVQVFSETGLLVDIWSTGMLPGQDPRRPWLHHLSAISFDAALRMFFSVEGNDIVCRRAQDGYELLRWKSGNPDAWPHDIVTSRSRDGRVNVYVAELQSGRVQRYSLSQ